MSHEICLFTCPTIMHAIKTPYRAHSMKNLKCPHCAKSMIFQKFLFISPEMNFNCTQCKAALELVNRVSPRLLIYSGLILVIPCFFLGYFGQEYLVVFTIWYCDDYFFNCMFILSESHQRGQKTRIKSL